MLLPVPRVNWKHSALTANRFEQTFTSAARVLASISRPVCVVIPVTIKCIIFAWSHRASEPWFSTAWL